MPIRPHWWVENLKKKMDFRFEIFHIFYAKNRPFFSIFAPPPYFWAEGLFGDFTKYFADFFNRFAPPPDPNLLNSPNLKCDSSLRGVVRVAIIMAIIIPPRPHIAPKARTRDNTCSRLARRRHSWPAAPSFVLNLSSK